MLQLKTATLRWRHNGCDGVLNHQPHGCLINRLLRRRSKKTSKLRVTGLCAGNSPGTGEFPAQMVSNAENVSIWWRHMKQLICMCVRVCGWDMHKDKIDAVSMHFRDSSNISSKKTHTTECHYKVVQWKTTICTPLPWAKQNINQGLHSQKTPIARQWVFLQMVEYDKLICIFEWKVQNSLKCVPKDTSEQKSVLIHVVTWHQAGYTALPETMLTQFTDTYIRH